ncbi:GNAT family N-acetyltransferase [Labedaea rhizosphaerae]|uniref:RimJ/RimL family protein N-acetyltransferase n=1 Tax=Labedaea rhizosphaerae TaxID=598644 RepID=A0A4R6SK96_LABRH|nr:GNAT family N-acetyltransferase [Labedaea rhizosphaerae]TDQ01379.1 RimJ/RimL family protein N-acetyltransferase [Labedaea rhizosphaerae]
MTVPDTARVRFRRFTESDVDKLVALDGDPEVMRYLDTGKPRTREDVEQKTLPSILGSYVDGGGYWAAIERATGAFLGWGELTFQGFSTYELGYRLVRAAWGRGYGTEIAKALLRKAFDDGAERVIAQTMAVNARSRRVMEKAGLEYVRTFVVDWPDPIPGTEHGEVEYYIDIERWRQRCAVADGSS